MEYGIEKVSVYKAIKYVFDLSYEGDIIIFSGEHVCNEAYLQDDRMGNIYLPNEYSGELAIPLGIGIAATNAKRVFVVGGEDMFLNNMSLLLQASRSELKNLVCFLFVGGCYHYSKYLPAISDTVISFQQLLTGFTFRSFVFNHNITDKLYDVSEVKELVLRSPGPLGITFYINENKRPIDYELNVDDLDLKDRVKVILEDDELTLEEYVPPVMFEPHDVTLQPPTPPGLLPQDLIEGVM